MAPRPKVRETLDLFFHQVCDRQRLDLLDEVLAPGFVFRIPPDRLDSLEEVKAGFRRLFNAFPDLRFTILECVAADREVLVRWRARGTHLGPYGSLPPTGRLFRYGGVGVLVLDEAGRITETWMETNLRAMVEKLRRM